MSVSQRRASAGSSSTRGASPTPMQCEDCEDSVSEMPSFIPSLIIEALGYPAGLGALLVCQVSLLSLS